MKTPTLCLASDSSLRPAAAYVRMSTEHQQYSTSNQMDVIVEYARTHGFEIIKVYSDEGKSGLSIKHRDALAKMIEDVESGRATFSSILVYDISRWGRFQDADESAHYEYICRRSGVSVHYCAEMFENDGSPMSNMTKGMRRMMAGIYSRDLSEKVFRGACRLIRLGYRQGGVAGYGLRRMLVDHTGKSKGLLTMGEHKSIQTDRVILVLGPEHEVEEVRWMFRAFVYEGLTEITIARLLNAKGIRTDYGREWSRGTVHQVLTNEKYIGHNVYHRTSFKLKSRHVRNAPEDWVRAELAWEPMVAAELFEKAQRIILERSRRFTDEEMLHHLSSLLDQHGKISGILIDEQENFPSSAAFRHRFGSLINAYSLIGYTPATDYSFIRDNREIRRMHPELMASVVENLQNVGATVEVVAGVDLLLVNRELKVSIVISRHTTTVRGTSRWAIRLDSGLSPDITIAVRLQPGNCSIQDYYLFPALDMTEQRLRMGETNGVELDGYQFDSLEYFFRMTMRIRIGDLL